MYNGKYWAGSAGNTIRLSQGPWWFEGEEEGRMKMKARAGKTQQSLP